MAELFDDAGEAILVARSGGATETISDTAADLLDVDVHTSRRSPCWEIARLKTTDGSPFCDPDCAIWREARAGRLKPRRTVMVQRNGVSRAVELISIVAPPYRDGPTRVFHLIVPLSSGETDPGAHRSGATRSAAREPLRRSARHALHNLSPREREILALLAEGLSTSIVASRLCISAMTVRNHVKHILSKLDVHRRIDAILLWLDAADVTRGHPDRSADHIHQ